MGGYTLGDVARICGVPRGRLRYWERTRLLGARRAGRGGFEFSDLVCVRRLLSLLDEGVPLRRIRRSLESARREMPELERPLAALRASSESPGGLVLRLRGALVEPDGQLVLELSSAAAGVSSIDRRADGGSAGDPQQEAEAWFERGCRLDTERSTSAQAIEAYERAIAIDPGFADAHCNLGTVHYNLDRKKRARECFERALALVPHHLEAHLNLAAILEEEGRCGAALRHYKRARAIDPLSADTHVSLALLYERLALPGRARECWRRYLQIDPDGSWADVARRHLEA